MSVYIGPCSYGTPEPDSGERFITTDSSNNPPTSVAKLPEGPLNMRGEIITNLGEPLGITDAATYGFVHLLFNNKVDWAGGRMTGELSMGSHKLTNVGDPEDNEDAVNKQYMLAIMEKNIPYDMGRYLVFPHADETKTYFAIERKRNIDLSNGKQLEAFNCQTDYLGSIRLSAPLDCTQVPVEGKTDNLMQVNTPFSFRALDSFDQWTFLFSVKPNLNLVVDNSIVIGPAGVPPEPPLVPGLVHNIIISFTENSFNYTIHGQSPVSITINTEIVNHFAFEYVGQKLIVWLNGISRKTHHNVRIISNTIFIGLHLFGIISYYNRELSKQEIIEHFIQKHVAPFTNNKVSS